MKNKRKKSLIIGVLLLILGLGLGYAFLTTTLNISGTTDVDANTWNVYWDNVQVAEGSVAATTPTIDSSKTTVTYSAHLSKPGDYFEFTVDAKNDGSIDAMIDTINFSGTLNGSTFTTLPPYLYFNLTYADDTFMQEGHLLRSNGKATYKMTIAYRTDIDPSALPQEASSISLSVGINYAQADSTAIPVTSTINLGNSQFTYEPGMTWGDWLESDYNLKGYVYDNENGISLTYSVECNYYYTATFTSYIYNSIEDRNATPEDVMTQLGYDLHGGGMC